MPSDFSVEATESDSTAIWTESTEVACQSWLTVPRTITSNLLEELVGEDP